MGFLDEIEGKAATELTGNSSGMASTVLQMINNQPGGLSGLVQQFHDKGMGGLVNSWIGSGQNLPISAQQIQQALGDGRVQQIAAKAGVSPEVASSKLAEILPMIVDKLTPNGQVPPQSSLLQSGMSILESFEKTGTNG